MSFIGPARWSRRACPSCPDGRVGVPPRSETFYKDTVCSERGAANAKEEELHGGVSSSLCGSDARLPEHFGVGQGTGCAASLAVSVADAAVGPDCAHCGSIFGT